MVLAIICALLGVMSPLAAAISMAASTLTLLLFTVSVFVRGIHMKGFWVP